MHLNSSLGKGDIFWLSFVFRISIEGKYFSSSDKNVNLSLSETGNGFCKLLLSMSLSEKIGRSIN